MATRDLVSTIDVALNAKITVSGNGTEDGSAVLTTDMQTLTFGLMCSSYTDGTHALAFVESDDNITYTAVPAAKIIGDLPSVTAATADGGAIGSVGVFSNMKYVKPQIVSTSVTTGGVLEIVQISGKTLMHS